MHLQLRNRTLDLSAPQVMGVLNVTPDSFSDGGQFMDADVALRRAAAMVEEGASIIDVGGESTRPGAEAVAEGIEIDRVAPVIERIRRELGCVVSIDTMKPAVMRAACAAGAEIVNDVNALRAPGAIDAVREAGAAAVLMHMQGRPHMMQQQPQYEDVTAEVRQFLIDRVSAAEAAGIARERLIIDPGFGFGKTVAHNLQLFAVLSDLAGLGVPVMIGVSRKSMFGQLLGLPVDRRVSVGIGAAAVAAWQGVNLIRTHDVQSTVEAIRFVSAVQQYRQVQRTE
jgi:dihydropteroate synthase